MMWQKDKSCQVGVESDKAGRGKGRYWWCGRRTRARKRSTGGSGKRQGRKEAVGGVTIVQEQTGKSRWQIAGME